MVLYFIGLGLGDPKDITVKGLEIVKKCKRVYLESYTSILTCGHKELEKFYNRSIILADRDMVEQNADEILNGSDKEDVAFLVVGDPFGATTHSDLVLRANEKDIPTKSIHNASIMNAIGCVGLQLYNFGETVSIPFWTDNWRPSSFYDKICANLERGMHTLCLLDIKVKERSEENMIKGRDIFEPPRFMRVSQACQQLVDVYVERKMESLKVSDDDDDKKTNEKPKPLLLTDDSLGIGVARVGSDDQKIISSSLGELKHLDFGYPLHSLVIPGDMHPLELDAIKMHALPFF